MISTRSIAWKLGGGAISLALLLSIVTAPAFANTADPAAPVSVGDFEASADGWALYPSGSVTGQLQVIDTDADTGNGSARLAVDASAGSGYLELSRTLPQLDLAALTFSVKSADVNGVSVRVTDSTGQAFQHRVPLAGTADEWQRKTLDDFDNTDLHWGGAGDGVWHGPASKVAFLVDDFVVTNPDRTAVLQFDAVEGVPVPSELALFPITLGNTFTVGQPATLGLTTTADEVSWSVTDESGAVVEASSANSATLGGAIPLGITQPGWYQAVVTANTPAGPRSATTDMAIIEHFDRAADKDLRFGIATHFGQNWNREMIPLIEQAGFGSVRDEAYWNQQEVVPGTIEWTPEVVNYTDSLADANIDLYTVLSYGNPNWDDGLAPTSPEGIDAFANYAVEAVGRFGPDRVYDVWNEWNWGFGDGPAGRRADSYLALLKETYTRVKAAYPQATLVGPVSAGVPADWLNEFFAGGGLDYIDGLSIHPYSWPVGPEVLEKSLQDTRAIMAQYGDPKPMYVSEHGWPTGTDVRAVDDLTQARYLAQSQAIALSNDVARYVVYNFMEKGTDDADTEHRFGIVHNRADIRGAYTPKPSYVSLATSNRLLAGKASTGKSTIGAVTDYAFAADASSSTHVLWASEPSTVSVVATTGVTVTDLYGASVTLDPSGSGAVSVSVGTDPVYVEGAVSAILGDATHSLSLSDASVGAPIEGTWTIDNSTGASARSAELSIGDESWTASAPAGDTTAVAIELPASQREGTASFAGTVSEQGATVARLSATAAITSTIALRAAHAVDADGNEVLRVILDNRGQAQATIAEARWSIGDEEADGLQGTTVAAGGTVRSDILLSPSTDDRAYTVTVTLADQQVFTVSGTLHPAADAHQVDYLPITVDGTLDAAAAGASTVSLGDTGPADIPGWGGDSDLSGDLTFTWDADHLNVSAVIVDDTQYQPASGGNIWQGDSLQIAVADGAPGDATHWNEIGFALTGAGPEAWQWQSVGGSAGAASDIDVAVVRDEAAKTTTYEAAIPWSAIAPFAPSERLLSVSAVVNESDGAARRGWYTWGGGIAEEKDSAQFNTMLLAAAPASVPTASSAVKQQPGAGVGEAR
ncbi:sugar-binding protein [Agreia sp. COWG]|uniref:sugar-binding protein n=1 Tax=Agreia sp. COWG TaxID=2773266 RepID=UPI00192691AA|nr:sugar-binding protein [Agreia sp. COWG]CAD6010618.1 Carb-bd_dom_fam9 domain-containing protein [Agreia sp. COWG]